MIHYMTTQGVGDAWVGNELRIVAKAGIPFRLHALNRPKSTYFSSEDVAAIERDTNYIYPLGKGAALVSLLAGPLRFRGRFFAAMGNALGVGQRLARAWSLAIRQEPHITPGVGIAQRVQLAGEQEKILREVVDLLTASPAAAPAP